MGAEGEGRGGKGEVGNRFDQQASACRGVTEMPTPGQQRGAFDISQHQSVSDN